MLKRIALLGMMLAVFLLAGTTLPSAVQAEEEEPTGLRENGTYSHTVRIPYNIKTGNWVTGIHLNTGFTTETLKIYFWGPSGYYANSQITITTGGGGWTGLVEDLLPPSVDTFQSPTRLSIYSINGKFTVTQSIMNGVGFGYQTFYSYPYASPEWPNWNPSE